MPSGQPHVPQGKRVPGDQEAHGLVPLEAAAITPSL
jgi:hypothetical protein